MIYAQKKTDAYPDLIGNQRYEVERVFSDRRIKIGKKKYLVSEFDLYHNDEPVSFKKAYLLQVIND